MNIDISISVTDQVRLHVRHWPGIQPRAFLLLHGLTSNARLWDEVACRLTTRGYPVYAVDLRGHGESDAADDGDDTATAAADVARVGAALGLSGVVVAGHSWGASVALRLAAENPELVGGLALVDGGWSDAAGGHAGPVAALRHQNAMVEMSRRDEPCWCSLVNVPVMLLPVLPPAGGREGDLRDWVKHAEAALPQAITRWYQDSGHHPRIESPERITNDLIDLAGETGHHLFV